MDKRLPCNAVKAHKFELITRNRTSIKMYSRRISAICYIVASHCAMQSYLNETTRPIAKMKVAVVECFNPIETRVLLDNYRREGVIFTRVVHNICLALKSAEIEPVLFYPCKDNSGMRIYNEQYHALLIPASKVPLLSTVVFALRLLKELKNEKVEFVFLLNINTSVMLSFFLSWIYPTAGLPAYPNFAPAFGRLRLLYRYALNKMRAIIVPNEVILKQLIDQLRIKRNKVIEYNFHPVQVNIVKNAKMFQARDQLKLKPGVFRVAVYAGNFGATFRDPREIPKAMKIIKSKGMCIECHIFGLDPKAMQIMKRIVNDEQVDDIVRLYGRIPYESVLALLSLSSLAINPWKVSNPYEGMFSLEALSFGLPLIMFNLENSVTELEGAYLIPNDSASIASLIRRFYENRDLLLKKSNEARDISRNFSIERTGQKLSEIIHLLIKEEKT